MRSCLSNCKFLPVHCRIYLSSISVGLHLMSMLSTDILQYQVGLFVISLLLFYVIYSISTLSLIRLLVVMVIAIVVSSITLVSVIWISIFIIIFKSASIIIINNI